MAKQKSKATTEIREEETETANFLFQMYSQIPAFFKSTGITENIILGIEKCCDGYCESLDMIKYLDRIDWLNLLIIDKIIAELKRRNLERDYEHLAILTDMKQIITTSQKTS